MNKLIGLFLISFLISCNPNQDSQENKLQGLWKLHVIETLDSDSGKWLESEWMKNGNGFLLYDGIGSMSLVFTPEGYEDSKAKWNFITDSLSYQDAKDLSGAYWYTASYTVDESQNIIEHTRIVHSNPGDWGEVVQRKFEFKGDTLILAPLEFNLKLKWLRNNSPIKSTIK